MARILIVEDDHETRTYIVQILKSAGYSVQESENGLTSLEQIRKESIDLIITDIFMPNMDGFELLSTIALCCPDRKVIVISGGGMTMTKKLIQKASKKFGAIDFIAKPFKGSEIIHKVEMALNIPIVRHIEHPSHEIDSLHRN
ncbi:MAG: response regulator [Magnetococcus sp. DMHC-6]